MPTITDDILIALYDAKHDYGSVNGLAVRAGINPSIVQKWLTGKTKTISEANYERIYPFIRSYLPDDPRYWPRNYTSLRIEDIKGEYHTGRQTGLIPILSMVDTEGSVQAFLTQNEPIPQTKLAYHLPAFDDWVRLGFLVNDSTMEPDIHPHDILLCEGNANAETLRHMSLVVAKFQGEPPICRELRKANNVSVLQSRLGEKDRVITVSALEWILRVRYIIHRV